MFDYETEEQQIDAFKAWWRENRSSVLLGLLLGGGIIFSWVTWVSYQENQLIEASDMYTEVIDAMEAKDSDRVSTISDQLRDSYADSTFASMASLVDAKMSTQDNNLEDAVGNFQWIIDNSSLEEMRAVAQMRKARVLLSLGKTDEALASLPPSALTGFTGLMAEIRGDIYAQKGEFDKARTQYNLAKAGMGGISNPAILAMKLDDLAIDSFEPVEINKDNK